MSVNENIADYMNSRGKKEYTKYQVSAILIAIPIEREDREDKELKIKTRTKQGKEIINSRIADIANKNLNKKVTSHDVWLCKVCRSDEYQDRTNRCAWGFKDIRKRLGYDENTGYEIV